MSSTGRWDEHARSTASKARRKLFALFRWAHAAGIASPAFLSQLYLALVRPVLEYASQHWGVFPEIAATLEKTQTLAARWILGCGKRTPLDFLRRELGWQSITERTSMIALRFVQKLVDLPSTRLEGAIFRWSVTVSKSNKQRTWWSAAQELLRKYELPPTVEQIKEIDAGNWGDLVKERVRNHGTAELLDRIHKSSKLQLYGRIKSRHGMAPYLTALPMYLAAPMAQMRAGSARLRRETGAWLGLERTNRVCLLCPSGEMEDEVHFVCVCPVFDDLRSEMVDKVIACFPQLRNLSLEDRCRLLLGADSILCAEQAVQVCTPVAWFLKRALARRRDRLGDRW